MRKFSAFVAAFALFANTALAANVPQVTLQQSSLPGDLPDVNLAIANVNASINPQSTASFSNFRNYLDNGEFAVQQRGTAATQGGTTGAPVYVPDRWAVSTNVTSGAGFGQVVTSSPSPLTGSAQSFKVYRNSGALTQPVCAIQEVPTSESQDLQGQSVTLSFYAQALAGLAADNGGVINAYIIYGTGTDQGLGTLTASPAITPAWTGINSSMTAAYTLTTSWARYTLTGFIPTTANEIGVEICFTPTATGAGTTDGFAVSDAQLEQGTTASSFEYRPYGVELAKYQRYYVQVADLAATFTFPSVCNVTTANTTVKCSYILPVTMRTTPTVTVSTATSFGIWLTAGTAGTCTTLAAAASASTPNAAALTCTTGGTIALGTGTALIGAGTAGTLGISADF
jgi:hypothetical protein